MVRIQQFMYFSRYAFHWILSHLRLPLFDRVEIFGSRVECRGHQASHGFFFVVWASECRLYNWASVFLDPHVNGGLCHTTHNQFTISLIPPLIYGPYNLKQIFSFSRKSSQILLSHEKTYINLFIFFLLIFFDHKF